MHIMYVCPIQLETNTNWCLPTSIWLEICISRGYHPIWYVNGISIISNSEGTDQKLYMLNHPLTMTTSATNVWKTYSATCATKIGVAGDVKYSSVPVSRCVIKPRVTYKMWIIQPCKILTSYRQFHQRQLWPTKVISKNNIIAITSNIMLGDFSGRFCLGLSFELACVALGWRMYMHTAKSNTNAPINHGSHYKEFSGCAPCVADGRVTV